MLLNTTFSVGGMVTAQMDGADIDPSSRAPQGRGDPEIEPLDRRVASLLAMTV
jgi:hypothetical protein